MAPRSRSFYNARSRFAQTFRLARRDPARGLWHPTCFSSPPEPKNVKRRNPFIELYFGDLPYVEEHPWEPAADVLKTREEWIVKVELAGIAMNDLSVGIEGKLLKVSGIRRDPHASASVHHDRMEIAYSAFERRFELPCDLQTCSIATTYRDGILLVIIRPTESGTCPSS
jgi:HSP20 family molecular chaperone IbpA